MGAYSTIVITRSRAIAEIVKQMGMATNEELATILDLKLEDRLYNCTVVDDGTKGNDDHLLE